MRTFWSGTIIPAATESTSWQRQEHPVHNNKSIKDTNTLQLLYPLHLAQWLVTQDTASRHVGTYEEQQIACGPDAALNLAQSCTRSEVYLRQSQPSRDNEDTEEEDEEVKVRKTER